MGFETLGGLPGILAFLIIVGCIASIFGFRWRRPGASRVEEARAAGHGPATAERRPAGDHAGFRGSAEAILEPLLKTLVDRARARGCEARYEATGEAEATRYRLEIRRPDHPAGQPLPYISFAAAADDHVDVVYGGVFPGPSDHNRHDTEIGWRTVRWDQVDDLIATFTHKVFAHFD